LLERYFNLLADRLALLLLEQSLQWFDGPAVSGFTQRIRRSPSNTVRAVIERGQQ